MSYRYGNDGGGYPSVKMTKHTLIWINQKETAIIRGLMGLCADAFQGLCVWAVGRGSHSNKIIMWLIPMNPICSARGHTPCFSSLPPEKLTVYPTTYFLNLWQSAIRLAGRTRATFAEITHTPLPRHTLIEMNTSTTRACCQTRTNDIDSVAFISNLTEWQRSQTQAKLVIIYWNTHVGLYA